MDKRLVGASMPGREEVEPALRSLEDQPRAAGLSAHLRNRQKTFYERRDRIACPRFSVGGLPEGVRI